MKPANTAAEGHLVSIPRMERRIGGCPTPLIETLQAPTNTSPLPLIAAFAQSD